MTEFIDRRSGSERRVDPPFTCSVPCKAIDLKLDAISKRLDSQMREHMPRKMFMWLFGGLSAFTVIIIGGMQWQMNNRISSISSTTKILEAKIEYVSYSMDKFITITNQRIDRNENLLDMHRAKSPYEGNKKNPQW